VLGDHDHRRSHASADAGRLRVVLAITIVILGVQVAGALLSNSLALVADAGHALTDAAGIALALGAIWIGGRPATTARTYGFLRFEILAAAVNAVVLFGVAGFVLYEAWRRISLPPEIAPGIMLGAALIGLAGNAVSLRLLHGPQKGSLNMRGAYLEVMGDLLGSIAVVVAAVVVGLTGWTPADLVASVVIGVLILPRTWRLLRDAVDILLEATPRGVDMGEVRSHILEASGVDDVHDLHAWTITSGLNVVSAHVVLEAGADPAAVLDELCACLSGDFDIEHSTLQLETHDRQRLEAARHA
jgi:cobalt-zinc-cadmium efflux system protein